MQKFETNRKVIHSNGDHDLQIFELWYYTPKTVGYQRKPTYISGLINFKGEFRGEYTILEENILCYLEDGMQYVIEAENRSKANWIEFKRLIANGDACTKG